MIKQILFPSLLATAGLFPNTLCSQSLPDSSFTEYLNLTTGLFDITQHTVYTYDGNGRTVRTDAYDQPSGSISRTLIVYDAQGNEVSLTTEQKDELSGMYTPTYRLQTTYNIDDAVSSRKSYQYDHNLNMLYLSSGDSSAIIYDNQNRPSSLIQAMYHTSAGTWRDTIKVEYMYSGNGTEPVSTITYHWNSATLSWQEFSKSEGLKWELGFDPTTGQQYTVGTYYLFTNNTWEKSRYDSISVNNNRADSYNGFTWNGNSFVPDRKQLLFFDNHGRIFSISSYRFQNSAWVTDGGYVDSVIYANTGEALFRYIKNYKQQTDSWPIVSRTQYFYSNGVSVKTITKTDQVTIYPNPATTFVTVKNAGSEPLHLTVFSAEGKKVLQLLISSETETILTEGWAKGVYTFKLQTATGIETKKLVVK